ncbi:MAG: cation:proton antiporter [Dehalococcoidia bacterium]
MLFAGGESDLLETVTQLVFQLAVILILAKLGGEVFTRYLRLPAVIGELLVGVAIGPYALGDVIDLGTIIPGSGLGKLFERPEIPTEAISLELFSVSQIAVIVLLFVVGLETNLTQFMRYARPASVIALGGVIFPFFFGAYATVLFGFADGIGDPKALFMGAVMTATSVGITARVLSERKKLDTPEGVTILAAAVIDDVLGILALTVAVGVADTQIIGEGGLLVKKGEVSIGAVLEVAWKALAFLVVWFGGGLLVSKYVSRFVMSLRVTGAGIAIALGLAFLASGLAESFGLAFIIGAYATGLALSNTEMAKVLEEPFSALYNALVPIFFVVQGMQVDVTAFGNAIGFGVTLSALAIVSKVLGSGLPALGLGFNAIGAARIGFGMLPRGEVALIIAGIGLTKGVIGVELFGVAIFMTIVTTLLAPIVLVPLFARDVPGTRAGV